MKYSKMVVAKVLEGLCQGLPQKLAAQRAGVNEDTVSLWKRKRPEFRRGVEMAQAEFIGKNLRIIQGAAVQKNKWGQTQWQAAAWLLERRHPEHFAHRDVVGEVPTIHLQLNFGPGKRTLIPVGTARRPALPAKVENPNGDT